MSDCNVCLYSGCESAEEFDEYPNTISKRNYSCSECGEIIPKGTKHQYVSMTQEGEKSSYRTCNICAEIRRAFNCDVEMYGGMFWEQMEEDGFPYFTHACLNKLKTAAAKKSFVDKWREWKFSQEKPEV